MISGLLSRLQSALLTAFAVAAVLFGAYALGGRAARRAVEQKASCRQVEAAEDRRDVDVQIDRMPDGESAERLRDDWSRD
ncbi:TPA: hypothetical protein L4A41_002747 [Pseudomonas aeruginosa]|nr:hypothetical protein [Pseudomonas aeruginosa]